MDKQTVISLDNEYIMHTYGRLPLVPDHGSGASLWDVDGNKYIDFTSGIGVNALGYSDHGWVNAVYNQAVKYQHVCNYYYCEPAAQLAKWLITKSGLTDVFFCNSGAEANECVIKLARKYSFDKYGSDRYKIVTLQKSFHGRTITTLAATGQDVFHKYFDPFTDGFVYCPAEDISAIDAAIDNSVCAVLLEVIQGEGGVNILSHEYVSAVEKICHDRDVLLIIDEVQTGIGRTGMTFAFQNYGIKPDIITLAKALAGGIPMGACISGTKTAETLGAGMHGSTFGANPIASAAALYITSCLTDDFLSGVIHRGNLMADKIASWENCGIKSVRHMGLMIGVEIAGNPKDVLKKAFENGLLVLTAGTDVIRLLPPLNISMHEIDEGLQLLQKSLTEVME